MIAVFQFSDTKNYIIFVGYTPNLIKFGCSGAELGPFEVAWLRVSERFAISKTGQKPGQNRVSRFFIHQLLRNKASKFDEIWSVTHKYNVVFDIRKLENCNQMEKS